jgi:hypothetical protein
VENRRKGAEMRTILLGIVLGGTLFLGFYIFFEPLPALRGLPLELFLSRWQPSLGTDRVCRVVWGGANSNLVLLHYSQVRYHCATSILYTLFYVYNLSPPLSLI